MVTACVTIHAVTASSHIMTASVAHDYARPHPLPHTVTAFIAHENMISQWRQVPVEYGHTQMGMRTVSIALNGQNFDPGTTDGEGKPHRYRHRAQQQSPTLALALALA